MPNFPRLPCKLGIACAALVLALPGAPVSADPYDALYIDCETALGILSGEVTTSVELNAFVRGYFQAIVDRHRPHHGPQSAFYWMEKTCISMRKDNDPSSDIDFGLVGYEMIRADLEPTEQSGELSPEYYEIREEMFFLFELAKMLAVGNLTEEEHWQISRELQLFEQYHFGDIEASSEDIDQAPPQNVTTLR